MRWPAPALAAAFSTATACGSATGTGYQGQPLFSISGQMVTQAEAPLHPIRLAVAWYADTATLGGPQAIVTQDVQYQGSFPLDYRFSFYGPPPESALNVTTVAGATFRAAWGVLIAYEDLNGNGQLDTIAAGGTPIDRILGTSIGNLFNGAPAKNPVHVAYVDGQPPAGLTGYVAGYNLYRQQATALPAGTQAELDLSSDQGPSELDLFVCPDFVTGAYLASPNSGSPRFFDLPCLIPPSGGVRVAGSLLLANGVPTAWIRVTDGTNPLRDAKVTLNGAPLTYSESDQVFEGTGSGFASEDAGVDVLAVELPNEFAPRTFVLSKPSDFAIETPSPDIEPRFLQGSPIEVDWTSAPGASVYTVSLISTQPPYGDDLQQSIPAAAGATQQLQLVTPGIDGPEWLTVFGATSEQPVFGLGGSVLFPGTYRSAYLDLAPADAGLSAFGTVELLHGSFGRAFVQPYEGNVSISAGATVTVDGQALAWKGTQGPYVNGKGGLFFDAGTTCDVEVAVPGLASFDAQVQIPGDFVVNPTGGPVRPGQVLDLSWSPSADAGGYNVFVEISDGGQEIVLNEVSTSVNSVSMVMPTQTGWMDIAIIAVGTQQNPHFGGVVSNAFRLFVSP